MAHVRSAARPRSAQPQQQRICGHERLLGIRTRGAVFRVWLARAPHGRRGPALRTAAGGPRRQHVRCCRDDSPTSPRAPRDSPHDESSGENGPAGWGEASPCRRAVTIRTASSPAAPPRPRSNRPTVTRRAVRGRRAQIQYICFSRVRFNIFYFS